MTTRVLIADDHKILRDGLRTLLDKEPAIEVLGEASDGRSAVQLARELNPDVVIMDIGMPGLNGIDATRQVLADVPGTRVLALSMHSDKRYVTQMLQAGASGYLLKDSAFGELTTAIRTVMSERVYLSPSLTDLVVRDYVEHMSATDGSEKPLLSPREREVLQLLAEGKSTKLIASDLSISVKTVETHRKQIMNKLDMHSIAELTKYAVREGITEL